MKKEYKLNKLKKRKNPKVDPSAARKFLENYIDYDDSLNAYLKDLRTADEMTQAEFAKILDIPITHLSDIENNRKNISPERAAKFARALGESPEYFIGLVFQKQLDDHELKYRVKVA